MSILDQAIQQEQGVGKLAAALGVNQTVVSMWKKRGLPRSWEMALRLKYGTKTEKRAVAKAA